MSLKNFRPARAQYLWRIILQKSQGIWWRPLCKRTGTHPGHLENFLEANKLQFDSQQIVMIMFVAESVNVQPCYWLQEDSTNKVWFLTLFYFNCERKQKKLNAGFSAKLVYCFSVFLNCWFSVFLNYWISVLLNCWFSVILSYWNFQ